MRVARLSWLVVLLLALSVPAYADNVTVSGNVNFSSLDGSALDHDGSANGTFTVNDGDLTVTGNINCNDSGPGNASACAMAFDVSGNVTLASGSALFAENRTGGGNGGNISIIAGGTLTLGGTSGSTAGAIISSDTSSTGNGGNITLHAVGNASFGAGSVVSSGSLGGNAGAISVTGESLVTVDGQISAGPGRSGSPSNNQKGGNITILSMASAEPSLVIGSTGSVVSQGENAGSGLVRIDGCGLQIAGQAASLADNNVGGVTVRSGTGATITGRVRADATANGNTAGAVRILARNNVVITGGAAFALTANAGGNNGTGGSIDVISTDGTVTATGNAAQAGSTSNGTSGGRIGIAAKGNITLNNATLNASAVSKGGAIDIRSYSGGVSWLNGTGDVRPTGSATSPANRGTIVITYCTTLTTAGSSFPVNGSTTGPWPTTGQTCSPAAPSLPSGESLPDCNDAPIAVNDAYTVAEGGSITVPPPGVLGNDFDPDLDPITAVLISGPANASSFSFSANGSFSYTHNGSETISDSFTYQATDGSLNSNTATVLITITPVNDPPVANNDNYTVAEGGTLNVAAPGVKANDTDPDGPSNQTTLVSGPANASSFVLNLDGSFVYTHNGSETTSDSFTYQNSDGFASSTATVFITVTAVNDVPVANNDSYTVAEGGTLNGAAASGVIANDTDPDGPTLTATLVSGPANAATFSLSANGGFTYTHNGSETTSDSFTYTVSDGAATSNVATVNITITPVNDAPVAANDAYTVAEGGTLNVIPPGVLGNDSDADNVVITAQLVSGPANATLFNLNPDGSFTYQHNGSETTSDSFTYRANDGSALSNIATVNITVTAVNDVPVANNDNYTVTFGGSITIVPPGVIGNDTDPDGPNALTATLVTNTTKGTLTFNANGGFTYQHGGVLTGNDTFTYTVSDGAATSNTATVTISIVNQPPVANNDTYAGVGNTELRVGTGPAAYPHASVSGSVLGNDTDPEATPLVVSAFDATSANGGTVSMNPNGTFSYRPAVGFVGTDSFNYTASDGFATDMATVIINVVDRIWYIRNTAAPGGDGRSHAPFTTLTQAQAASSNGDAIFVHIGVGTTGPSGIILKPSQRLIGEGTQGGLVSGPYTLWPVNGRPALTNGSGPVITLSSNNTVSGLNVSATGVGIIGASGSSATIRDVAVGGGTTGFEVSSSFGTYNLFNVVLMSGQVGMFINGGAPTINAQNLDTITNNFPGIQGTSTGTLNVSAGSTVQAFTSGAIDLTNMTLNASFDLVSAVNGVNGIRLLNTPGSFSVTGTGAAGTGGTINNMSNRAVWATNAGNVSLRFMNLTNSGQQLVLHQVTGTASSALEVRNSTLSGSPTFAIQTASSSSGSASQTLDANTGSNNFAFSAAQTTLGALTTSITNNTTTFNGAGGAFTVTRNGTATGTMTTTITGNTIGTPGVANSGCSGFCLGIQVNAFGSTGTTNTTISNNNVNRVDFIGVYYISADGNSNSVATITNNNLRESNGAGSSALWIESGALPSDTNALCATITGNSIDGTWDSTMSIFLSNNNNTSIFKLPGYAGGGTNTAAVQAFVSGNNGGASTFANLVPGASFSGGAGCP